MLIHIPREFNPRICLSGKYAYGVNPPEWYKFLQIYDNYVPLILWAINKKQKNPADVAMVDVYRTPIGYDTELISPTTFYKKFANRFLEDSFKFLRQSGDTQYYIVGNGMLWERGELLALAVMPNYDCCIPTVLITEGNVQKKIISSVIKEYICQIPFKVVKQDYLNKFIYQMPNLSPVEVCKILKQIEDAKSS